MKRSLDRVLKTRTPLLGQSPTCNQWSRTLDSAGICIQTLKYVRCSKRNFPYTFQRTAGIEVLRDVLSKFTSSDHHVYCLLITCLGLGWGGGALAIERGLRRFWASGRERDEKVRFLCGIDEEPKSKHK